MIRIDHLNIVVSDIERSVRFYTAVLGLRRGFEKLLEGEWVETVTGLPGARAACVFMETGEPGTRIELLQYFSPEGEALPLASLPNTGGVRHFGFMVDGATFAALPDRLRAAGMRVFSEPVEVPFAVGTLGKKRLYYFLDPDGVILEAATYE